MVSEQRQNRCGEPRRVGDTVPFLLTHSPHEPSSPLEDHSHQMVSALPIVGGAASPPSHPSPPLGMPLSSKSRCDVGKCRVAPELLPKRLGVWRDAALANVASRLGGQGHA